MIGLSAGWLRTGDAAVTIADPESHLLQVATHWEVIGRRPEEFPPDTRTEMLARYPWRGFGTEMLTCFKDQARRKPGSAAGTSVDKKDMAGRAQPLEAHPPA